MTSPFQSMAATLTPAQMHHWDCLHRAIREREPLHMNYLSLSGQRSQRTVWPLGLFYWGGKWTLGAWCYRRRDYRDFRVDTIQQLTPATDIAPPEAHINLNHYTHQRCQDWEVSSGSDTYCHNAVSSPPVQ